MLLLPTFVVVLGGCRGGGHALGAPGSIPVGQSSQTIQSGGTSGTFNLRQRHRPDGRVRGRAHGGVDLGRGRGPSMAGGEPGPLAERVAGIPAPSTALDATDTIWQFFAQNHRWADDG